MKNCIKNDRTGDVMKHIRIFISTLAISLLAVTGLFSADTDVRLNSLGFLPNNDKRASIDVACTNFSLIRGSDAAAVYTGTVGVPITATDSGETVSIADFSAYTTPGTYYLNVAGVGNSSNFNIADDAYNNAFYMSMKAFYLWRCGTAVSYFYPKDGNTYTHPACHTGDGDLFYVTGAHTISNSTKGWHDAGDYNKYVVNAGVTMGTLFMAWEMFQSKIQTITLDVPNTANGYPDFLKELKWETDWLLTMAYPDGTGRVSHKMSAINFDAFELPQFETAQRYFVSFSTSATADFTAILAMASRIFQPYDAAYAATCLNAAVSSYSYLAANTAYQAADQSAFNTGTYITTDSDDRLWAAAEMWETTGNATYLADFEASANIVIPKIDTDWGWGNVKNLGMFTYLFSSRSGRNAALVANITTVLNTSANSIVATRNAHAYGRPLGTSYYWGCNGAVALQAMILQIANRFSPNVNYTNTALDAIGSLFGRNTFDRSFVTGLGINPPMNPHHRPSAGDSIINPWPGYLVGGSPGRNNQDTYESANLPTGLPSAQYWVDVQAAYSANEVAINWQAPLVYALAGFKKDPPTPTATATITGTPPTPTITPTITGTYTPTATGTITQTHTVSPTMSNTRTITQTWTASPTFTVTLTPTSTPVPDAKLIRLSQCFSYPNPTNGSKITFIFTVTGFADKLTISVYTFGERKIYSIVREKVAQGTHTEVWAPSMRLANGLYYYAIEGTNGTSGVSRHIEAFFVNREIPTP